MHDVRPDAGLVEPAEPLPELQLSLQAPVSAVIDVTGHEQEIGLSADAEVDYGSKGFEGSFPQFLYNSALALRQAAEPNERAVKVKVCSMNEGESWHDWTCPFL